jgi:excisionase family DNA binding protein
VNVKQAAQRLEVSAATVYALVACGKLRCVRVGVGRGTIRILDEHIAEFLAGAEPEIQPPPAPAQRVRLRHIRLS